MPLINNYAQARALMSPGSTDTDGYATWPTTPQTGTFTGIAPFLGGTYTFSPTVAVIGNAVDNYAWLSQRTDSLALQWLELSEGIAYPVDRWNISLTAKCVADLGLASVTSPVTESQLRRILRHVTLYTCTVADPEVHAHVSLERAILSNY